ncbi:hypothetical protein HPP92_019366 [Vanilla planifolia]|uniref:Bulb-type lectin domain-containing protein n=1 Tax=Vanilla planifolia TaxID=51239 RepID=A0A835UKP0_VANPL|nr:hypothetical protein HPP92_019849 [Vanilla planifolia]KAG0465202.1 hypothetical protein HPP92_019366 [Vanilla planifolia]
MAATSSPLLSSLLLLLLVLFQSSPSAANEGNVLLTDDILSTDSQLSNSNAVFVIQNDCNLVLYNGGKGFHANTHGAGVNCILTLNKLGQLIIKSGDGTVVWATPEGPLGRYAAVLLPNGEVGIFGPRVWTTPEVWINNSVVDAEKFSSAPSDQNLMLSSQVVNDGEKLTTTDYTFTVGTDCDVTLTKATGNSVSWRSMTSGRGDHCYVRLNFHGQLSVLNDLNRVLWMSNRPHAAGFYVLVLQTDGVAAIYGPLLWSTAYFVV